MKKKDISSFAHVLLNTALFGKANQFDKRVMPEAHA